MACRGCSQTGDCACAVIGDGAAITVTGTGSVLDPYVVTFDGCDWIDSLTEADPDLCTEEVLAVVQLEDGTCAKVPLQGRCAYIV